MICDDYFWTRLIFNSRIYQFTIYLSYVRNLATILQTFLSNVRISSLRNLKIQRPEIILKLNNEFPWFLNQKTITTHAWQSSASGRHSSFNLYAIYLKSCYICSFISESNPSSSVQCISLKLIVLLHEILRIGREYITVTLGWHGYRRALIDEHAGFDFFLPMETFTKNQTTSLSLIWTEKLFILIWRFI